MDLGGNCLHLGALSDVRLDHEVTVRQASVIRTCKDRLPVARQLKDDQAASTRNWALLLMVVLCVEFWMVVTTTVASHI